MDSSSSNIQTICTSVEGEQDKTELDNDISNVHNIYITTQKQVENLKHKVHKKQQLHKLLEDCLKSANQEKDLLTRQNAALAPETKDLITKLEKRLQRNRIFRQRREEDIEFVLPRLCRDYRQIRTIPDVNECKNTLQRAKECLLAMEALLNLKEKTISKTTESKAVSFASTIDTAGTTNTTTFSMPSGSQQVASPRMDGWRSVMNEMSTFQQTRGPDQAAPERPLNSGFSWSSQNRIPSLFGVGHTLGTLARPETQTTGTTTSTANDSQFMDLQHRTPTPYPSSMAVNGDASSNAENNSPVPENQISPNYRQFQVVSLNPERPPPTAGESNTTRNRNSIRNRLNSTNHVRPRRRAIATRFLRGPPPIPPSPPPPPLLQDFLTRGVAHGSQTTDNRNTRGQIGNRRRSRSAGRNQAVGTEPFSNYFGSIAETDQRYQRLREASMSPVRGTLESARIDLNRQLERLADLADNRSVGTSTGQNRTRRMLTAATQTNYFSESSESHRNHTAPIANRNATDTNTRSQGNTYGSGQIAPHSRSAYLESSPALILGQPSSIDSLPSLDNESMAELDLIQAAMTTTTGQQTRPSNPVMRSLSTNDRDDSDSSDTDLASLLD